MSKKLLLTGIQPTNKLTLGNYLGAIKKIVNLQDEYECILFVADLHALTIPTSQSSISQKDISEFVIKVVKMYIAAGINPKKSKIFIQSHIKEHLELFWFLLSHSLLGELKRMTQYKALSQKFTEPNGTSAGLMGLLSYPILMAADILLYDTNYVSLGEDQTQHLELTKLIGNRVNNRYKQKIFEIPEALNPEETKSGIKIRDLQTPDKKMSKSSENHEGVIFLEDNPETIKSKIMRAKTDSLGTIKIDRENQPGITNLIEIYAQLTNISLEKSFDRLKNNSYKELKEVVAEITVQELSKIQEKYKELEDNYICSIIQEGKEYCLQKAKSKMDFIKDVT